MPKVQSTPSDQRILEGLTGRQLRAPLRDELNGEPLILTKDPYTYLESSEHLEQTELAALKSLSLITVLSLGQHKALPGGPFLPAAQWAQPPQNSSPGRYHGAEVGQLTRGSPLGTAVTAEPNRGGRPGAR